MTNQIDNMEPDQSEYSPSPPWGRSTKLVVVIIGLLLVAFAIYRFHGLVVMVTVAALIAYLLNPLVKFVNERTRIARGWVILIIYLVLAGLLVWLFVALGVAVYNQTIDLLDLIPDLIDQTSSYFAALNEQSTPIVLFNRFTIEPLLLPWDSITNQLLGLVQPTISTSGGMVSRLASTTLRTVGNFLFVFVISIYMILEAPNIGGYLQEFARTPGYQDDAKQLATETGSIWSAYLRGQVVLGLIIFVVVWLGLSILGVRNALALALLSGLLEFVPTLGPIIGTGAAMIVAFFQPQNPWNLLNWQYALLVLGLMVIIQQVENNILVPRIVGRALDLQPIIILVGVFMGASLAGVLGAILAAPLLATMKLFTIYAWHKLFDLPPFPETVPTTDLMLPDSQVVTETIETSAEPVEEI
jgi:predicted PurR-regulated permease PerM